MPYLVVAVALLCVMQAAPVFAHAKLVRSDPAARAILTRAPAHIRLWFSEPLESAYSQAELRDASDRVVPAVVSQLDSTDHKLLVLSAPPLPPGRYAVHYRVMAVDGHVLQAHFRFTVRPPA